MPCAAGSSPLARGLQERLIRVRRLQRIIPARAGFTRSLITNAQKPMDHPRSRGVYLRLRRVRRGPRGSSPLARGLLGHDIDRRPDAGIIPARAGFTHSMPTHRQRHADHPRSRGVYVAGGDNRVWELDHPRSRGVYSEAEDFIGANVRIIPARAGFTTSLSLIWLMLKDHPRSRGVYILVTSRIRSRTGSSPLARGLPRSAARQHTTHRIIPARAGFTGHPGRRG